MAKRPDIPEPIKRAVRQRCGFGCVICGLPLYEYEHMLKWSVVKRHVASEITLLCRFHHGQRTDKLLPIEAVREANLAPFNLNAGASTAMMLNFSGSEVDFVLGNNSFNVMSMKDRKTFCPLVIDKVPVASFTCSKGRLYLNLNLHDDSGRLILKIVNNEIVIDSGLWDVEWIAQTLTIRNGPKRIFLKIKFEPPGTISIKKGVVFFNGVEVLIGKDYLYVSNSDYLLQECGAIDCSYGVALGVLPPGGGAGFALSIMDRGGLDKVLARKALRTKLKKVKSLTSLLS